MAVNYTYEYRNKSQGFPQIIPDKVVFKDVDASVATLVKQIESYINTGNYSQASSLMTKNAAKLKGYIINAVDVNRIIEDIRNTQIFAKQRQQSVYFDSSEPGYLDTSDVWISGGTYK